MITNADCEAVQKIVYDSGAAEMFRVHMRGTSGGQVGRFDRAIFLTAMLMTVIIRQASHLTAMHEVLTQEVPLDWQFRWGIRRILPTEDGQPPQTWVISECDLQNLSRRFAAMYNYSEIRLPDRDGQDLSPERSRRLAALNELVDTLIEATLIERPSGSRDWAIDSTGIWASERMRRNLPEDEIVFVDLDESPDLLASVAEVATLQEHDHDDEDADTSGKKTRTSRIRGRSEARVGAKTHKDGRSEWFYGYDVHAIVRAPQAVGDRDLRPEPALLERMRVTPAGLDVVAPSLEIIDAVLAKGQIENLMADRHYSYKQYERWLNPLVRRGINQVVTLRETDQGFREWDGALIAASWPHCTSTPAHLGTILEPGRNAPDEDWDAFHSLIAERESYACDRRKPLDADGKSRWSCPGHSKIGCPLIPGSVAAATNLGLPIVGSPPPLEDAPRMCKQASFGLQVTTPAQAILMKLTQHDYWGTPTQRAKADRRTYVEGYFGTFKGDNAAGKRRGSTLFTGLPHVTLELAAFAVSANLMLLRAWHRDTGLGDPTSPLLQEDESGKYGFHYLNQAEYDAYVAQRHASGTAAPSETPAA